LPITLTPESFDAKWGLGGQSPKLPFEQTGGKVHAWSGWGQSRYFVLLPTPILLADFSVMVKKVISRDDATFSLYCLPDTVADAETVWDQNETTNNAWVETDAITAQKGEADQQLETMDVNAACRALLLKGPSTGSFILRQISFNGYLPADN